MSNLTACIMKSMDMPLGFEDPKYIPKEIISESIVETWKWESGPFRIQRRF